MCDRTLLLHGIIHISRCLSPISRTSPQSHARPFALLHLLILTSNKLALPIYHTLHYPTIPYLTPHCATLPYPTLPHLTLYYITLHYLALPYPTLPYPTLPHLTPSRPLLTSIYPRSAPGPKKQSIFIFEGSDSAPSGNSVSAPISLDLKQTISIRVEGAAQIGDIQCEEEY